MSTTTDFSSPIVHGWSKRRLHCIQMLSWTGSLNQCIGVFRSNPWKQLSALLNDSSGCWWNDEISIFPSAVLDSGKYFLKNFSTTSSHVRRLFPLNEWSHLFASPTKEKKDRLRQMASSRTPNIFIVLQILICVARCAYGSSLGRPRNRFPWINWIKDMDIWCWPLEHSVWLYRWSTEV